MDKRLIWTAFACAVTASAPIALAQSDMMTNDMHNMSSPGMSQNQDYGALQQGASTDMHQNHHMQSQPQNVMQLNTQRAVMPGHRMNGMSMPQSQTNMVAPSSAQDSTIDQLFVAKATDGSLAEVALSQLALTRACSPHVRHLANQMITDHSKASSQLQTLAQARGITLPQVIGPSHQAVLDRLGSLSGKCFDKLYMSAIVEDHENAIALFEKEAQSGSIPELRAFAAQMVPHLMGHAKMSYSIASMVGAPVMATRPASLRTAATTTPVF